MDLFRSEPRNKKARKVQWTFLGPSLEIVKRGCPVDLFRSEPSKLDGEIVQCNLIDSEAGVWKVHPCKNEKSLDCLS